MLKKIKDGDLKLLIILSSIITILYITIEILGCAGILTFDIFFIVLVATLGLIVLIIPMGIILFPTIIIISIMKLIKNKNIKYLIPIIILSLCFIPIADIERSIDFKNKYDDRMKVVEEIKNGKLSYNEYGVLDKKFKNLAENGHIEVVYHEGNDYVIGFFYDNDFLEEDGWLYYSTGGIKLLKKKISSHINFIDKMDDNWFYVHF